MKNKNHSLLFKKLMNLRSVIKNYLRSQRVVKKEINLLEHTETRLRLIQDAKRRGKIISETNNEIRDIKLKIRECQRDFGRSDSRK